MTVCTHCKARHWECERTKSTGHFSTCCSQGKVQLPPSLRPNPDFQQLLEGSDSGIPAFRENARSYNNALYFVAFTIDSGTLGALITAVNQRPTFAKTWLICPAEATDTQLGPDGADSRIQRSTLTKLDSMLGTGHRFAHGDQCPDGRPTYQVVSSLHPSAMPLRSPLLFPAGEDDCLPNIPLCSSNQAGSPFVDEEDEDEEEGDKENSDGERGSRWRVSRSQFFTYYLHKRDEYFSIPHCTQRAFLAFVMTDTPTSRPIDSTYPSCIKKASASPRAKNRPRENTQHYQDAMACVVKYGKPSLFITVTCNPEWPEIKAALGPNDQACNRPDLIARVFEAKLNRLCDDVFGNKQRAGCLGDEWRTVSLLYFVVCFLSLC
ncbi:BZ3500_MvSof-1268-A1-R1_Chr11-2g03408 [Microbotryum saponariae]|uniref:BZ3500_MvSof-1268-A1-R1_Chr11-2g03408 protein n=1 Tax=Microbotryum saponariae TaxID=289078 RepID=A0A2X0LVG3_9BASI|nr:BZ3500_MvSof-1268-A1-R1_Chr11-2g03408 [Microbotryum saponariae]SDA03313.1 BZ3501_MvSof-1269-A2-R1_Chr11g02979 [Microbotryum saponariae]